MLGTIPSQGCQLSLLRAFRDQNELPKSFGSQDRILPKYGHGRGHFGHYIVIYIGQKVLVKKYRSKSIGPFDLILILLGSLAHFSQDRLLYNTVGCPSSFWWDVLLSALL